MKVFSSKDGYLLRLERGEEIHETLTAFAAEKQLKGAVVQGIGAIVDAEVGFYAWDKKGYERRQIPEPTELLSLNGNLCAGEEKPFLHAHVVLLHRDGTLDGGHLFRGVVAVTGEISVQETDLNLVRRPDPTVKLALLESGGPE